MEMKSCYLYDGNTKEYIGVGIAYKSPLEKDVFITPPNSTYEKPPEYKEFKVACFIDDKWHYLDDYRGEYVLNKINYSIEIINNIGSLPDNVCHIPKNIYIDYTRNPKKYKIINNELTDISETEEYRQMISNVGKHLIKLDDGSFTIIDKPTQILDGYQVVDDDIYNDYLENQDKYKVVDGVFKDISDSEEYQEILKQRILRLHLTAADVERALYKARGITFDAIIEIAKNIENIDLTALKIELKAKDFYRGNEYIDKIGALLNLSTDKLDNFFKTNDYRHLMADGGNQDE